MKWFAFFASAIAVGEVMFAPDLGMIVPSRPAERGIDELRPNVRLGHLMHLHQVFHVVVLPYGLSKTIRVVYSIAE